MSSGLRFSDLQKVTSFINPLANLAEQNGRLLRRCPTRARTTYIKLSLMKDDHKRNARLNVLRCRPPDSRCRVLVVPRVESSELLAAFSVAGGACATIIGPIGRSQPSPPTKLRKMCIYCAEAVRGGSYAGGMQAPAPVPASPYAAAAQRAVSATPRYDLTVSEIVMMSQVLPVVRIESRRSLDRTSLQS